MNFELHEGVSLMQGKPLFDTKERPSQLEKSVPLINDIATMQRQTSSSVRIGRCFSQRSKEVRPDRRERLSLLYDTVFVCK
ncbi:MAG: hypothetical protein HXO31_12705 [Prevotella sp.]|nr:hypothetical protein [Prevotella sp.]